MRKKVPPFSVPDKAEVRRRLDLIFEWYRGMIDPETGRLAYIYDHEHDIILQDGRSIRQPEARSAVEIAYALEGGFGFSLTDRRQGIDITGHVASGFIKSISNGVL